MTRAPQGDIAYWNGRVQKLSTVIQEAITDRDKPSKNPLYEPQYWWNQSLHSMQLLLFRYSRGDQVTALGEDFGTLLDSWVHSNALADDYSALQLGRECRDWTFDLSNLNHYNWCFWVIGLAILLEVPDQEVNRAIALIGGEGEDALLDRVIATVQRGRTIGSSVLHRKPYARLLAAIGSDIKDQPRMLRDFVHHWYAELARKGKDELWWYIYGDSEKHPLSLGSYFGRWCIEAAVAAKVFAIDDSLCLGHEHYPGDLLRLDGPSTHAVPRPGRKSFLAGLLGRVKG
jgi:hypothetical protein